MEEINQDQRHGPTMELETLSAFQRSVRELRLRKERQRQEKILRDGQRIGIACPSRRFWIGRRCDGSSGPHHQDSGEAKIRESTAGVSRKPSSDGKACGCSSKHLCGLTAWNT